MKISIITVCLNAKDTILDACESVARQRTEVAGGEKVEVEHIVVDGGSTDGSVEVIRGFAERQTALRNSGDLAAASHAVTWISELDKGLYDGMNKGIRMATGDVVGILNADDYFSDETVLADVAAGFADGQAECLYGDIRFVRGEGMETVRYYSSKPWRPWMHNWGYMPAHPSLYVRRTVFEKHGGYKLGYAISADFEWMVRILCKARIRAKYLPRCMVTMRLGGKSTAGLKAMYRLNAENVRANRENGFFCCIPMMAPKYFYKILGYVFRKR